MKKVIFILLGIVAYTSSFAQFNQGNFLVGGNSKFSTSFTTSKSKSGGTTTTNGKSTSFSLEPQAGYFVIDNLAVGAGLGLTLSSFKYDGSSDKSSSTTISLSPFVRYYFDKFYAQGAFTVGSQKNKNTIGNNTTETKLTLGGWSLLGGYPIFINDSISLEPQVGYASSTRKDAADNKSINGGIFIGIGLYGYISK